MRMKFCTAKSAEAIIAPAKVCKVLCAVHTLHDGSPFSDTFVTIITHYLKIASIFFKNCMLYFCAFGTNYTCINLFIPIQDS